MNGKEIFYYPTGSMESETNYVDDYRDGIEVKYDSLGNKVWESMHKKSVLEGPVTDF